jgi:hypothetical protein
MALEIKSRMDSATLSVSESQSVPHRPEGIENSDYAALLVNPICERLAKGLCSRPCSTSLDIDHVYPKSLGGDNSLANLRLLCSDYNRNVKNDKLDPYYLEPSYFDQFLNTDKLRDSQREFGHSLVTETYREIFETSPAYLFKKYLLIAAVVGAGKTLMMIAILCGINEVINSKGQGRKRIRRVLWLVHQNDLVHSLKTELHGSGRTESEITAIGLLKTKPKVGAICDHGDWHTYGNSDIVVATPQSLWEAEKRKLTREEKQVILSRFDAVIIDECHYAVDQYIAILELTPLAYKFLMSATPMNESGEFFSQMEGGKYANIFRLFSSYGYQEGHKAGFLKSLPEFSQGRGKNYIEVAGGESEYLENGKIVDGEINSTEQLNVNRDKAVICKGIEIANATKGYDAHVMIRTGSIVQGKLIAEVTNSIIDEMQLEGDGWKAFSVWSGCPANNKLGSARNPWMLSKRNGGKCTHESMRIVVATNLGQFGVNQPYCNTIVYVEPNLSLIEIVQRLGRAIRRSPTMKSDLRGEKVYVVWNAQHKEFAERLKLAIDYLLDMQNMVTSAFLPLQLEPIDDDDRLAASACAKQPLEPADRMAIAEFVGRRMMDGEVITDEVVEDIAKDVFGEYAEARLSDTSKVIDEVAADSDSYRNNQFHLPRSIEPLRIVFKEKPQLIFSKEELATFVENNPQEYSDDLRPKLIDFLIAGDEMTTELVTARARSHRLAFHRTPSHCLHPHQILGVCPRGSSLGENIEGNYRDRVTKAVKTTIRALRDKDLSARDIDDLELATTANRSLYTAAAKIFNLNGFKSTDIVDYVPQISDALCSPVVDSALRSLVIGDLMHWFADVFEGCQYVYSEQLSSIHNYLHGSSARKGEVMDDEN